jgi:hypothetical protein
MRRPAPREQGDALTGNPDQVIVKLELGGELTLPLEAVKVYVPAALTFRFVKDAVPALAGTLLPLRVAPGGPDVITRVTVAVLFTRLP